MPVSEKLVHRMNGFSPFEELDAATRLALNEHIREFTFLKKQVIHREGFPPPGLFIVRSGKVKIYRVSDSSREIIVHIAGEGEMVGYNALMRHSEYHFWAEAIEETEVILIPRQIFYNLIETHPAFSVKLMQQFALQFDKVMDKMVSILSDHVRKRTAKTLLWLMEHYGVDPETKTIRISLSRHDLAHLVATNTETLVRALAELKKEQAIELKRRKISVVDEEKLNRIAFML